MKRMLKDFGMMKNFMILGYLPQDMEPEEESGRGDAMPFPGKAAIMMVYDGDPLWGGIACPT
jgi:hypothetical protein